MLILLPPSEGKRAPARGRALRSDELSLPTLHEPRAEVLAALVDLCTSDGPAAREKAAEVLGLGRTLLDEVDRNAALLSAPTARADEVYSGVLYEALDVATLGPAARRRATAWLAVASGLFGLVRPGDRIPAYRLSADVDLPGIGHVGRFWSSRLDEALQQAAGRGLVVDLRSSAYATFWRPDAATAPRVAVVRVLHEVDGTRKVVSHFNKATKGRLVRALLEDGGTPRTPQALAAHLAGMGWTTEVGEPGRAGVPVDVVVSEL